ncbi:MAG: NADH-quinone oxidoreductase subunit NuoG [Anaerolineae bacterium]|nr:NADH-quinone oxidoreductase subunit NuoG [Anaerolineae bacterium]
MPDTVRVFIDDKEYQFPKGANLVDAAKTIGNDIPVFCYHPKLAPVGMCRMCLVELGQAQMDKETQQFQVGDDGKMIIRWQPKLQTACTTTVADGLTVRTATKLVQEARDDILEFLLTSHPLDCPVCDKGGECPLQNLTLRHGPGVSRFVYDEKMHLAKHIPLGDLIYLDRERCIQCARCTRFQDELVGDDVLAFHERGRRLQIITTSNPPFDTYFSGNTTDICPVGALTTADFRFSARPWELTEVPSICPHCPVGCNISATTRADRDSNGMTIVKRIMPRQNEQVNEIWICDKGRFGHHHSRSADRIMRPLVRNQGKLVETTWEHAYAVIAEKLNESNGSVGAIAGPMLSNEDLWELRRLVQAAGGDQMGVWPYHMTGSDLISQVGLASGSNFKTMGKGTTIIVAASDIEEEAPIWYLRIKGAADRGAKIVTVNARRTEMDRWAKDAVLYTYGGEIEALRGVDVSDAENLVILVGGEGLNRVGHRALMQAAAEKLISTGHVGKVNNGLLAVWPGANTQGAFDMGFSAECTEDIHMSRPEVLFLADADVIGEDALSAPLLQGGFTVVSEMFLTETAALADVVLPRQSFAERDGSYTNGERRVQRFYTAQSPIMGTLPDWKMFAEITQRLNGTRPKLSAAAVMQDIVQNVPRYAQMSYPNLAKTEPQFPDVGGQDLYYGGTAYENTGGLGIQWPVEAESGTVPTLEAGGVWRAPQLGDDQLLIVPIKELYDRQSTFRPSHELLRTHIPDPYVVLNAADAERLGIADGDMVTVSYGSQAVECAARLDPFAPKGAALLPRNLNNRPSPAIPVVGSLKAVRQPA